MSDNQIPEELKCDHLFLLVGGNPLPNWVAARLLLRENGKVYLVYSDDTKKIAEQLSQFLEKKKFEEPEYIPVSDPYASDKILSEIVRKGLKKITSGQVGLNYTGGTKVMSVHAYRTIENQLPKGVPAPIFSYLDPQNLEMRFDNGQNYPVGLNPDASLNLRELLSIHDIQIKGGIKQAPIAEPVVEVLEKLHRTKSGRKDWLDWIKKLKDCDQNRQTLEWPDIVESVAIALAQDLPLTISLKELCEKGAWPFDKPGQLIHWLEGPWMESHVAGIIQRGCKELHVSDYGFNLETKHKKFNFEGDVITIRGYQCHFISCYTGSTKGPCKRKLFEVFTRARQIGGDEARVALVCLSDNPERAYL